MTDAEFEHRFPPEPQAVSRARRLLAGWLVDRADVGAIEDLLVIASELTTNALHVASSEVVLRAWLDGRAVVVEVVDDGPGFTETPPSELPDPLTDVGRGLFLARALSDELSVQTDMGGTRVRSRKRTGAR